jgi:PAS domain S-box-containing protein
MNLPLRCLLVEDSEDDAQLVLHRLRSGGFDPSFERVDNAEAMRAALERQPWDIVISDFRMPGFSGMDALTLVRARDDDLPFILLSGQMGEQLAVEAMRAGASDYLTKDHMQRLAPVVQRELQEAQVRRAHRQSEAALRSSSTRHAAILMSALDGYCLLDSQAYVLEVNAAYARMSGYRIDELLTMNIADLEAGESAADTGLDLQKLLRSGYDRFDSRHRRKNGSVFDVEVSAQIVSDENNVIVCFLRDVSERKQAAAELQASAAQLRFVTDHAPMMLAHCDAQRRYKFVNLPYARMFDLAPADLVGRHAREVLGEEAYAQVDSRIAAVLSGQRVEFEIEQSLSSGSLRTFHVIYAPELDANGLVVGFVAAKIDISLRKQAEAADAFLAEAGIDPDGEPFFADLAGFLATSLQMDYICIDRLDGDQLTATTVTVWCGGAFEDNVRYALADTPCGQVPGQKVCCYPARVCSFFPKDAALQRLQAESYIGVPLLSHHGVPIGLIAAISRRPLADRTLAESILTRVAPRAAAELERMWAESALVASEARNRAMTEAAHDAIATADQTGLIVTWNQGAKQMFGYTESEALGQPMTLLIPERHRQRYLSALQRIRRGADDGAIGKVLELRGLRKDGTEFPLEMSLSRWKASEDWFVTGIIRDISERRKAEEQLQASHAVLSKFNALAVGRELRMIELKSEINELCARLGEPPRHHIAAASPPGAQSN